MTRFSPLENLARTSAVLILVTCAWGIAQANELRLEDLHQTRDRPLFSVTRRPPPKIEISRVITPIGFPPTSPVPAPSLRLIGVIFGEDEQTVIVQQPPEHKPVRLSLGDNIDGSIVISIAPRSVVFRRARRFFTLVFPSSGAPDATIAVAPRTKSWTRQSALQPNGTGDE